MDNPELLTRAVQEIVPRSVAEEKLKSGKPLRLYLGIDPTGARLHLGHSVPLRKMRAFQDAGHHVILLIGSFTAMVGDPTGRDELRKELSAAEVRKNYETYIEQAKLILDMQKLEIRYNHEWLEKLSFKEILALSGHFTVQQMLKRDMFAKRIAEDAPISITEFMYPLMQGYDSVMLDVDFELGGNDQLFNMLAGRTLQKAFGKREKCVMTLKLLEGTDGRKMSKTYENCVYLTDTPDDMYGKILSMPDNLIPVYMEYCTSLPLAEVRACQKAIQSGSENPKRLKMRLAREIVTMYHSSEAAHSAEERFENIFAKKETPEDMPSMNLKAKEAVQEVLVRSKLASSGSDAKRLIAQGGVSIDGNVIKSPEAPATPGVLKVGKRRFLRLVK